MFEIIAYKIIVNNYTFVTEHPLDFLYKKHPFGKGAFQELFKIGLCDSMRLTDGLYDVGCFFL